MKAFVLVNVKAGKSAAVMDVLKRIEAIEIVYACWGRPDIIALVDVKNERALSNLVMDKIQPVAGIESTDTHIVIE